MKLPKQWKHYIQKKNLHLYRHPHWRTQHLNRIDPGNVFMNGTYLFRTTCHFTLEAAYRKSFDRWANTDKVVYLDIPTTEKEFSDAIDFLKEQLKNEYS